MDQPVYSIATNFDDNLLPEYAELGMTEVYGAIGDLGGIGQGRPLPALRPAAADTMLRHISFARKLGLGFTLVLNPGCTGNREFSSDGLDRLRTLVDRAATAGATSVTVSNPVLAQIVREAFPEVRLKVSVLAQVDSLAGIEWWLHEGADVVVLAPRMNRDFAFLRRTPRSQVGHIELLANNLCLPHCPLDVYHSQVMAHGDVVPEGFQDPCLTVCNERLHANPHLTIASPWIRPEDVHVYEDVGIHRFKLTDRCKTSDWLLRVARSYASRRSPADLATILNAPESPTWGDDVMTPGGGHYHIRYDVLDGLIDHFVEGRCDGDCTTAGCEHCRGIARRAVTGDVGAHSLAAPSSRERRTCAAPAAGCE